MKAMLITLGLDATFSILKWFVGLAISHTQDPRVGEWAGELIGQMNSVVEVFKLNLRRKENPPQMSSKASLT